MNNLMETYPLVILKECSDKYRKFFTHYETCYSGTKYEYIICILDQKALDAEVNIKVSPPCTGLRSYYTDDHELWYCIDLPFRHRDYYNMPDGDVIVVGDLWAFKEEIK